MRWVCGRANPCWLDDALPASRKSLIDEASQIQRDRHPRLAGVARRQPRNLVEPVDDGVAMNPQPLRGRHEIETALAPGDQGLFQRGEVVLPRKHGQLRPREASLGRGACRVQQLAYADVRNLADVPTIPGE